MRISFLLIFFFVAWISSTPFAKAHPQRSRTNVGGRLLPRIHISTLCTSEQTAFLNDIVLPEIRLQSRAALDSIRFSLRGMWDRRLFIGYIGNRDPETLTRAWSKYRLILDEIDKIRGGEVLISCYYEEEVCTENHTQLAYVVNWRNNYIHLVRRALPINGCLRNNRITQCPGFWTDDIPTFSNDLYSRDKVSELFNQLIQCGAHGPPSEWEYFNPIKFELFAKGKTTALQALMSIY